MSQITFALSEKSVNQLFTLLKTNFHPVYTHTFDFGILSVGITAGPNIVGGDIDLQSDGTMRLNNVKILYNPLTFDIGIDIPTLSFGDWCIAPTPWGCAVRLPSYTFFDHDPDIDIPIPIGGIIESKISGDFFPVIRYTTDPGRLAGWNYLDAEDHLKPNKWKLFINVNANDLNIEFLDIPDITANIFHAVQNAVDTFLSGLGVADWVIDIIDALTGGVVDLVIGLLQIGDDIITWVSNLLGASLLLQWIEAMLINYFANNNPLYELEDPYPVLPYSFQNGVSLIPVKIPIANLAVTITADEMVLSADINSTMP